MKILIDIKVIFIEVQQYKFETSTFLKHNF